CRTSFRPVGTRRTAGCPPNCTDRRVTGSQAPSPPPLPVLASFRPGDLIPTEFLISAELYGLTGDWIAGTFTSTTSGPGVLPPWRFDSDGILDIRRTVRTDGRLDRGHMHLHNYRSHLPTSHAVCFRR